MLGTIFALVTLVAEMGSSESPPNEEPGLGAEIGLFKSGVDAVEVGRGNTSIDDPAPDVLDDDEDGDGEPDPRRGEPFVAPIPFRSPAVGWGGALAGGYIFRIDPEDRDSPPSTVALAGFGTENESFGGILTGRFHLWEDLWRVNTGFGALQINYDFYGIGSGAGDQGTSFEIQADTVIASLKPLRRLPEPVRLFDAPIYLGPGLRITRTENDVDGVLPPGVSGSELDETRIGLGVHLQRDSRDESFFPTSGALSDADYVIHDEQLGSDFTYQTLELHHRQYHEVREGTVLAGQIVSRFTFGDPPFSDLAQHDLRGYERGRYRDDMRVAGEVEIRQQLYWRFAGTVFTGLGQIAPDFGDFDDDNLLWSAGFGLRFRLTEENRMNYRADAAWGRDGFEFYFSLTEAF